MTESKSEPLERRCTCRVCTDPPPRRHDEPAVDEAALLAAIREQFPQLEVLHVDVVSGDELEVHVVEVPRLDRVTATVTVT